MNKTRMSFSISLRYVLCPVARHYKTEHEQRDQNGFSPPDFVRRFAFHADGVARVARNGADQRYYRQPDDRKRDVECLTGRKAKKTRRVFAEMSTGIRRNE